MTSQNLIKKTVLLLGKEKEGIPIEFLNILDNCVVIPQQGKIHGFANLFAFTVLGSY